MYPECTPGAVSPRASGTFLGVAFRFPRPSIRKLESTGMKNLKVLFIPPVLCLAFGKRFPLRKASSPKAPNHSDIFYWRTRCMVSCNFPKLENMEQQPTTQEQRCTPNPRMVSVREAAVLRGYTTKYIRDLLYAEKLPGAVKVGRCWRVPRCSVLK